MAVIGEDELLVVFLPEGNSDVRYRVRGATPGAEFTARWYSPSAGQYDDIGRLSASAAGRVALPPAPSASDWVLELVAAD